MTEEFELSGKRHFGLWQKKDRMVLLGYSANQNNVLCVRLDMLPEDERVELIKIALNSGLQNHNNLVSVLSSVKHTKSGEYWMTQIAMRDKRNDGSVVRAYVKDLTEVHPDLIAFYKGYAPKKTTPALKISEAEKAAVLGEAYHRSEGATSQAPVADAAPSGTNELLMEVLQKISSRLDQIDEKLKPAKRGRPPTPKIEGNTVQGDNGIQTDL